jgi:hypothetical protein
MGTWDGLSTISIVYNTKTNPKDGAILEIEISDTFSATLSPAGPGMVDLEVKYGSTTIFNDFVNADRAIRFRYEAAADVWFPISYVAVVAPPGSVQSVTGVNVDNTDPANPVVNTFSSFESYLTQGATSTITLDANSTPNHGIVIDFTVDPYTSLTVNSYPSPKDGALVIVNVNKPGGQLDILGAFMAANATQPRTYISKYSAATSTWVPITSIPSSIVSSVVAVAPITVSGTNTATISTSVAQNKLIGRGGTSGTGVMQEITIGTGLSLSGTILSATGGTITDVTATAPLTSSGGATPDISTLMTSGKLIGRHSSGSGVFEEITLGTNLSLSGDTLNAAGGGGSGAGPSYYYLNGSVNQGTFVANTYYEMSRVPIFGGGTDFTLSAGSGFQVMARFITDANDPSVLIIPAGGWLFDLYFSSSSSGGNPQFYVQLLKYDGSSFTAIADSSANPESITGGTSVTLYITSLAVPQTVLASTDRLAVVVYVDRDGRTITFHTEDANLAEIQTTFVTSSIAQLTGDVTAGPATAPGQSVPSTLKTNLRVGSIVTILDGQGGVIQTGRGNNFLSIPFSGTITGWTVLSSVSGSIEVAFWKDTYANYPPTVADSIFSPNPSLTSTNKNQATGLSIAVAAGDIIIPNVVSVTTCTNVTIEIQITRS